MSKSELPPILQRKDPTAPSVFQPDNLLREGRRQLGIPEGKVPPVCVLDPDGDIVRHLRKTGEARRNAHWACYHTEMDDFTVEGIEFGIVGCAVGASFAVLIAEEMFASGCELLISMTSSGQIVPLREPPYFVLIERALRDEGTSYHYLPPSDYAGMNGDLLNRLEGVFDEIPDVVERGATWTTDAPFRETETAISFCQSEGILAVEMEASALYAFSQTSQKPVICFAHVTNQMGNTDGDFEKGAGMGSLASLRVIAAAAKSWLGE